MTGALAIGVGCRRDCPAGVIVALVEASCAGLDRTGARLCTIEAKRHEPGLIEAAGRLGLPLIVYAPSQLAALVPDVATPSDRVAAAVGVPSVAEAAALAGAGPGAHLLVTRRVMDGATCAVAQMRATVHFIGAGPGAPDLITVRGRDLLAECPVCLYAGSLVPRALLAHCPPGARVVDTAPLSLDEIVAEMQAAHAAGLAVARLHSGDLSIWSALGEQVRRLEALGIPYTVTPGVPAFAAAAAALGRELTLPGVAQSLVLTRTPGRASPMPERETLTRFAETGAVLAIHLSIHALPSVVADLAPHYGADCPVALVFRASWPDERVLRGTLATIEAQWRAAPMARTTLILVGRSLADDTFPDSALYSPDYPRRFRGGQGPSQVLGRDDAERDG